MHLEIEHLQGEEPTVPLYFVSLNLEIARSLVPGPVPGPGPGPGPGPVSAAAF
jgi:hypothetical protein